MPKAEVGLPTSLLADLAEGSRCEVTNLLLIQTTGTLSVASWRE